MAFDDIMKELSTGSETHFLSLAEHESKSSPTHDIVRGDGLVALLRNYYESKFALNAVEAEKEAILTATYIASKGFNPDALEEKGKITFGKEIVLLGADGSEAYRMNMRPEGTAVTKSGTRGVVKSTPSSRPRSRATSAPKAKSTTRVAPVPAGAPVVPGSVPPVVAPVPAGAPAVPGSVPPAAAPVPAGAPAVPGSVPPAVAPPVLKGKKKKAKKEKKRAEVEAAAPSAPAAAPPAIETPVVSSGGVVDLEPEAGVEGESLRQAPELPDFAEKFISGATYTNHQNYKFPIESRNFSANGKKYESITVLVGEGDFQEELAVSLKNARSFRKGSNAASSLKVYLDGQKSRFDALNAVNGVEVKIESGVAKLAIDRHQYPLDLDTGNVDLSSFENSSVDSIRLTSENAEKLKRVLDSLRAKHKLLEDIPSDFKSSFVIVPNLETGRAKMHYSYEAGRMVEVQNSTNTGILLDGFSGTGNGFNFDRGKEAFDVAVKKLAQGEGVVDNLSEGNKTNYLALREDQYSIAERLLSDSDSATGLSYELGGKKHEVIEFYGTGGGTNIKIAVAKAEVEGEVMYGKIIDSSTKRNAGLIDAAIEGVETDSFDLSTQLRGYLKAKGAIAPELRNLLNFNKNRDGIEISEKPGGTKYKVKFVKIGADYKMKVQSSGKWTDEMILDKELNVEKLKGEILTAENN